MFNTEDAEVHDFGKSDNWWFCIFNFLTKYLNTNVLSIIIALMSGIIVNLYTSQTIIDYYYYAIACFSFSIFLLVLLIFFYEKIQNTYAILKRQNMSKEPSAQQEENDLLQQAKKLIGRRKQICFITALIIALLLNIFAIYSINKGNEKINLENKKNQQEIMDILKTINDSLSQ